jgi:hypothetical protein
MSCGEQQVNPGKSRILKGRGIKSDFENTRI